MRIGKAVILIGIVIVAASFFGAGGRGGSANAGFGEYDGMLFKAYGNVLVIAEDSNNRPFSMYILTWLNFQCILENGSIENVDTIVTFEKINGFIETIIELPGTGIYAFVCTPYFNESIRLDLDVFQTSPKTGILYFGIGVVTIGVIVLLLSVVANLRYGRK